MTSTVEHLTLFNLMGEAADTNRSLYLPVVIRPSSDLPSAVFGLEPEAFAQAGRRARKNLNSTLSLAALRGAIQG